jgi:hypothetical protein
MRKIETRLLMAVLAFVVVACSGSSIQMTQTHLEEIESGQADQGCADFSDY